MSPCIRVVLALALVLGASSARAQEDDRLRWAPEWNRVHPAAYTVVGSVTAFALVFDNLYEGAPEARLRGPTFLDRPVRAALMAESDEGREIAGQLSDALLAVMIAWPLIDSAIVVGIADTNSDVFWQLTWIAAESYALELLINTLFKQLVARERPHGSRCTLEDRLEDPARCGPDGRLRSFYSGHSSISFSAAGQVCVTHLHLPVYGSRAADIVACGAALLLASTISTLRIVADRHYVTDVLVGAAVGFATGFLLPYLLHYHQWGSEGPAPDPSMAAPLAIPPVLGWGGSF